MEPYTCDKNANICIFNESMDCYDKDKLCEVALSEVRKKKAIQCSHKRKDGLYKALNSISPIHYHRSCYLSYISQFHIERFLKRKLKHEPPASDVKRAKRSQTPPFDFLKSCLICGAYCNVVKDKKHPERWMQNKRFLCKATDYKRGDQSFKEML